MQEVEQRTPEWFALRENRLTASDFASAIGLKTAYDSRAGCWKKKKGIKKVEINEFMAFGIEQEDKAKFDYERLSGNVSFDRGFVVHPRHDWLGCSPDGVINQVVCHEIKCRMAEPFDRIPLKYFPQIFGQLACTEMEECHFQSWSPQGTRVWSVKWNEDYWKWMFPYLEEFWNFIENNVEPPRRSRIEYPEEIESNLLLERS